ncbi:MAG: asparagine--tRNA ligase [Nitrososphaeraceae archaeon]
MYSTIKHIKNDSYVDKNISIRGWIHRIRKQKENSFLLIRDTSGDVIQTIFPSTTVSHFSVESSVIILGKLKKDNRAPEGGYEIKGSEIILQGSCPSDYPIGEYQSQDLLLDNRHLAIRTRRLSTIFRVRSCILKYCRKWFEDNNWLEVTAPLIVKSSVEGGSTLFKLNYFDNPAYLSQSTQLYLESLVFSLGNVWTITESFRAEKSRTVRHLAEFSHLEAESPWIELDDLLKIQEDLLCYIIQNVVDEAKNEFNFLKRETNDLINIRPPFERISYKKAIEILRDNKFYLNNDKNKRLIEYGDDLTIESERVLTKTYKKPIFIIGYPLKIKPFYVKENSDIAGEGLAADLLAPCGFGEITSGGMREDNLDSLIHRIKAEGLNVQDYEWYIDLRKYGSVPHGGFGLGIERLMRWLLNLDDIKDSVPFPRTMTRVSP